ASDGAQVPWEASSLTGDFYFAGAGASRTPSLERAFWDSIKDNNDTVELQFFLRQFPQGPYSQQARDRIAVLQPSMAVTTAPAPSALASLPPPTTRGFNGRYNAVLTNTTRLPNYDLNASLEIDGSKITGFSTAGTDVRIC